MPLRAMGYSDLGVRLLAVGQLGDNVDSIEAALAKHAKAHEAYAKAMEMIGVTSAGAIAVVVALRPAAATATLELRIAIALLFASTVGVIVWFMSKGAQYNNMAQKILSSPNSEHSTKEPWWGRAARVVSLSAFLLGFYFLFVSA